MSKTITLDFSGDTELVINADREQVRLVVQNLLLNAVQAVSYGGKITVNVERAEDSKTVVVSVVDNGTGIRPEDLAHIFEPYFTTRPSGTGLGLALVRRIVEEHGGKIHAVNVPGGGAKFELALPVEG